MSFKDQGLKNTLIPLYKEMHEDGHFPGVCVMAYADQIAEIVRGNETRTILDYGAGKGEQYTKHKIHEKWGGPRPTLYDPAVPAYAALPPGPFDGVICTDVLEHIPELDLDRHISYLVQRARKWAFISVCCRPSECFLPNGVNEHVTLRPEEWWREKLWMHFSTSSATLFLEFTP